MNKVKIILLLSFCINSYSQNINWVSKAPLPLGHHSGSAVTCSGEIYSVGGQKKVGSSWEKSKMLFDFDPAQNNWTQKSDMPTARFNLATAAIDGKIYALGGDSYLNNNEMYDPTTEVWTSLTPMPTGRQHVKGTAVGGKLYIIGGLEDRSTVSNKNEVYDPQSDTWEEKAPIPTPKHNYATAVFEGKIYIFGGSTKSGSDIWVKTSSVEVYDPVTDTWQTISTMPTTRFNPGIAVINNSIFIIGGFAGSPVSNRVDRFDPASNTWYEDSPLPQSNVAMGSTVFDEKIYIVGGTGGPDANWNCYDSVYEGVFADPTHVLSDNTLPIEFKLHQNHPNPYNPSTSIKYTILEQTLITLKVFGLRGKEIATLVNDKQSPGTYEIKFDGSNLPSGTYFYRLQNGDYSETQKMVLLK